MTGYFGDLSLAAGPVVRALCGAFFIPHTIAKLSNITRASDIFEKIGFRPARGFVVLTATLEILAAFGLIFGVYPRIAGLMAAGILIVAAYAIGHTRGLKWRWQFPGIEYMIFWALISLASSMLS